jgi:hypothetical protein
MYEPVGPFLSVWEAVEVGDFLLIVDGDVRAVSGNSHFWDGDDPLLDEPEPEDYVIVEVKEVVKSNG